MKPLDILSIILRIVSSMSIRHSLLALLSTEPLYGLQLKDQFETRTGELWPLNVGQVYTTLARLERDGLIAATADATDDASRPYEITAAGRTELASWLRAGPGTGPPPRDDLVMKIMIAVSIDPVRAAEVVQSHRRQLLEGMRHFTRIKADASVAAPAVMMCDAELFRLDATNRWLDSVDARLRAGSFGDVESLGGQAPPTATMSNEGTPAVDTADIGQEVRS